MRIAVTTQGCDRGRSGIGQYAIQLLRQFAQMPGPFDVYVHPDEEAIFIPPQSPLRVLPVAGRWKKPALNLAWHQAVLPLLTRRNRHDVVFLPAANRRVPWHLPCPMVGTVHDFSSIHLAGKYDPLRALYITRVLPALVRRLDAVITVSESTKRDIVEFARYPESRVHIIPHGVDLDTYSPADPEAALAALPERYGIRPPCILYISRIEHPGKNHVRLIQAFEILKQRMRIPHQLVLAGSDWNRAEQVHELADKSPCRNDICFTGFVDSADLPNLYRVAEVFVFPSLYEGFGMPLLEAMAAGVPMACAQVSSLPEVGGDAALYFDPADPESMAASLEQLLADKALRDDYRARGLARSRLFSWRHAAERTLEVLCQKHGRHGISG